MSVIDAHLWQPLFDAVYEMNAAQDRVSMMKAVCVGLSRLVEADVYNVHILDLPSKRMLTETFPSDPYLPEETDYYRLHPEENPLVAHYRRTGETCARRVSDVLPLETLMQTDFYRAALQRLGFRYIMALPVTVDEQTVAGMALTRREPDFTLQQCSLLDAFAPHFRQSWLRHDDPWSGQPTASPRKRPVDLGLTQRQSEVLFWMTEGKQNREISLILDIRLTTVHEHVANILRKLGVENRHAATVYALRELDLA